MAWVPIADLKGPQGDPGEGVDVGFIHAQVSPSASWVIGVPDDFGRLPAVTIYLSDGTEVLADVLATESSVNIQFPIPTAGYAVLT